MKIINVSFMLTFCWPHIWQPYLRCDSNIAKVFLGGLARDSIYHVFAKSLFAILSFFFNTLRCWFHEKCLSTIMHKYLVCVVGIIFWLFKRKFNFLFFHLYVKKKTISVLETFNEILLAHNQWTTNFKSWLIYLFISFNEVIGQSKFVSSAKWYIDQFFMTLCISLI